MSIVLRQVKGETWEELHAELKISISEMQRWKQVAMEAMRDRLELPSKAIPIRTELRRLIQRAKKETDGWVPNL